MTISREVAAEAAPATIRTVGSKSVRNRWGVYSGQLVYKEQMGCVQGAASV